MGRAPAAPRNLAPKGLEFRGVHAEFLADTTPEIDFEGSRYSGKNFACTAKVILSCLANPGIKWVIARFSDTETRTKLAPEFRAIALKYYGLDLAWDGEENAFHFPEANGLISKVYAYGLKAQSLVQALEKVRGMDTCGVWIDQAEELPQAISEELRFATRIPGYPHQLIFSPNPPPKDHYLCDQFPIDNPESMPHRRYYCVSLFDNAHNLPPGKIEELEAMYPPTHPKHKSLILGQRGVNVIGTPVYDRMFLAERNVQAVEYDEARPVLEAFQYGQHHPTWVCAQRTYRGGLKILGAILGKRMFLEDFLPIVMGYRAEWFEKAVFKTCCDPPPDIGSTRYTNLSALRDAGLLPIYKPNSNAPDVREAVIQDLASLLRRSGREGFCISSDVTRFLVAADKKTINHDRFVLDGFESDYVWDEHVISVGSKKVRQPKALEWVDGAQRCIENLWLNFGVNLKSDFEKDRDKEKAAELRPYKPVSAWS